MQDCRKKMVFVSARQLEAKVAELTLDYEQLKLQRKKNWMGVSTLECTLHSELERKDAIIGVLLKKFEWRMASFNSYIVDIRLINAHIEEIITDLLLLGKVYPLEDPSVDIKIQLSKEREEHKYKQMLVDLKERELKLEERAMKARRRYEMVKMCKTVITSSSRQPRLGYIGFFDQRELNSHDNVQQSDLKDGGAKDAIVRVQARKFVYIGFDHWQDKIQELTRLIDNLKQEQIYVLNDQVNERNEYLDAIVLLLDDKIPLDFLRSVKEMKSKRIDTLTSELIILKKSKKYSNYEKIPQAKYDDKYYQYERDQKKNYEKNFNFRADDELRRKFEDGLRWRKSIPRELYVSNVLNEISPVERVPGLLSAFQSKPLEPKLIGDHILIKALLVAKGLNK